uniref:BED-type domain-containing protein n=1 Tax=Brassica oleracea var. oleracea TaxID=109376 RepID=A0A0D3A604_BRAOL
MASCDDGSESELDKSADEVETPISRKKSKHKKPEGASGSRSENKRTSKVWEHFTRKKEDNDRTICNYCGKEMACATKSGTTSLKKHVTLSCKSYQAWQTVNK